MRGLSYIDFIDVGTSPSGKTKRWNVVAKASPTISLGTVRWYAPWRRYSFQTTESIFDDGCLQEIVDFVKKVTAEHKEG